jgi:hypothetical protein
LAERQPVPSAPSLRTSWRDLAFSFLAGNNRCDFAIMIANSFNDIASDHINIAGKLDLIVSKLDEIFKNYKEG